jgi:hypothetical protein
MIQEQLRELEQRIDEVLYYVWDPIGVSEIPAAREEYSSYTRVILEYVLAEDLKKVAHQLNNIQVDSMGLLVTEEKNLVVAEQLLDFKSAVEEGLR